MPGYIRPILIVPCSLRSQFRLCQSQVISRRATRDPSQAAQWREMFSSREKSRARADKGAASGPGLVAAKQPEN